eukprot:gene17784-7809_t
MSFELPSIRKDPGVEKKCKCCGMVGYNRTTCGKIPSHPCSLGINHFNDPRQVKINVPLDKTCRGCFKRFNSRPGYLYHVRQGVCKVAEGVAPQQQHHAALASQHKDPNNTAKRQRLDGSTGDHLKECAERAGSGYGSAFALAAYGRSPYASPSLPREGGGGGMALVSSGATAVDGGGGHASELHWHYASRTTSSSTSRAFALVGSYISVRWDGDQHWYAGSINAFNKEAETHHICYQDDGSDEWLKLDNAEPPAAPPSPTPEDLEQPELADALVSSSPSASPATGTAASVAAAAAATAAVAAAVVAKLDDNFGHPYHDVICLSTKEFTTYMKKNATGLSAEVATKIRKFRKSYMEKIRVQNLKIGEANYVVNAVSSGPARQAPSNWFNSQNKEL